MNICKGFVIALIQHRAMTLNPLARCIGVKNDTLSNALSGRLRAGNKLLAGLCREFPGESMMSLTVRKGQVAL